MPFHEAAQKLFEEGLIGAMKLKNRVLMSAMVTNAAAEDGSLSPKVFRFYEERAKGGVAMIKIGACSVDTKGKTYPRQLMIHQDRLIPDLRRLIETVQAYDCKASIQLMHGGRLAPSRITGDMPVAPSSVPSRLTRETPRELTKVEIQGIQRAFAEAGRRAVDAGCDAIELLAGPGYLLSQFVSPATNKRTDEYGRSLENRIRFPVETIRMVREQVGSKIPILYRISVEEYIDGGLTIKESKVVCERLWKEGGVDALDVEAGWHESQRPVVSREVPPGGYATLAGEIRGVVRVPVIAGVRICNLNVGAKVLNEGYADFVAIARPLLADPQLVRKAFEGRIEDVRPCISCSYCLNQLFEDKLVECAVNPVADHEDEYEIEVQPATERKTVLVAGGGPAGLEACLHLAKRGHKVLLYEKEKQLGGQWNLASIPPYKAEVKSLLEYYEAQLKKLGVKVVLGEVTPSLVREVNPDVLMVATGSVPVVLDIPRSPRIDITTVHEVLQVEAKVGNKVAIIGGGANGLEVADYLAAKGKKVTIVEMLDKVGLEMNRTERWQVRMRLDQNGVRIMTNAKAKRIEDHGVVVDTPSGESFVEADTVVFAVGLKPNRSLVEQLGQTEVPEIYAIGDCNRVGRLVEAIRDGFQTASKI